MMMIVLLPSDMETMKIDLSDPHLEVMDIQKRKSPVNFIIRSFTDRIVACIPSISL